MKIVVLDGYTLNPGDLSWKALQELGEVSLFDRTPNNTSSIVSAVGEAEIIFTNKTVLSKEVLMQIPSVKYIGVLATGYNVVDMKTANEMGITVTNVPGYSTNAVAQMTFALLMELTNKVGRYCISVRSGDWIRSIDFSYNKGSIMELHGKYLGIVGFGQIGRAVAEIAQAFGMKVLVHSNRKFPEKETDCLRFTDPEELFRTSDVISLHCPLTEKTKGIINKDSINTMKDGVLLVNTARGELIVETDLTEALNSGKVGGAALDVISSEPMKKENPLLNAKNCIITPHIAWATKASRERLMNTAVDNLRAFLKGSPVHIVK
jgi:glycerate dehydrogenase